MVVFWTIGWLLYWRARQVDGIVHGRVHIYYFWYIYRDMMAHKRAQISLKIPLSHCNLQLELLISVSPSGRFGDPSMQT